VVQRLLGVVTRRRGCLGRARSWGFLCPLASAALLDPLKEDLERSGQRQGQHGAEHPMTMAPAMTTMAMSSGFIRSVRRWMSGWSTLPSVC
jgi:hypothetical protein